jgi:structure-specific recognition protein 1
MDKDTNNTGKKFVKGWSWGDIHLKQTGVEFSSNNQQWFNIPYNSISNVLLPTKNEIGLEFNPEDMGDIK